MSSKGGQNRRKHGGAQIATHGQASKYFVSSDGLLIQVNENGGCIIEQNVGEDGGAIQDGGDDSDIAKNSHVGSRLEEAYDGEDGEMASFETAVVDSNAEWIRAKVSNLGSIFGDGLDLGDKVKDICELFSSQEDNSPGTESVITLCSDTSGLTTTTSHVVQDVNKNIATPSSPTQPFLSLGKSRSYSDGGDKSLLNAQDRACLEEIEKGSQLSPEDKELFESKQAELRALELEAIQKDKTLSLMTPQELESMPEQGIEFEESVGPKLTDIEDSQSDFTVISTSGTIPSGFSSLSSSNTTTSPVVSISPAEGSSSNSQRPGTSVATISIATDKATNLTQILINTDQGQQVLQINASDLSQCSGNALPLGDTTDLTQVTEDNSEISGITVQDGFLVIPVNPEDGGEGGYRLQPADATVAANFIEDEDDEILQDMGIMSTTTANGTRVWACNEPDCDKVFAKPSKLKVHLMRHTGERPFKCAYPKCDWAFTTGYKLKRHEESHEKRKDFICDMEGCGRKFTTIYNLNTHKKLHTRPNKEVCPECGERFPTIRKLDLHLKTHKGAEKTYKCPYEGCDKFFFSPHCMGSHARVHQQDRDLTCKFEGCNKVFDKLCRLKQHMRSHTGEKPYVCHVQGCGWAFFTASKLKRHERKHTGERKWECPYKGCGKAFMRAEHLKGHLVTHSGEKPFACPVPGCEARFTAKSSMYVHIKKHTQSPDKNKIAYFCPMEGCCKKYSSKSLLWTHITKHYQAALGPGEIGVVPVFADLPPTLETLTATQEDSSSTTDTLISTGLPVGLTTPDGTLINTADLIDAGDQTAIATASIGGVVNPSMITRLVIPKNESGQAAQTLITAEGLVTNTLTTATTLLSPVASSTGGTPTIVTLSTNHAAAAGAATQDAPKMNMATDLDLGGILTDSSNSGSARTDFQSNLMLSDRARKRRKLLKDKSGSSDLELSELDTLAPSASSSDPSFSSPSDLMTSRGIIFKDLETGATYVQTQLLQDDPPNPSEFFSDDLSEQGQLNAELTMAMLQDPSVDEPDAGVEFTGTTINLQDLE